MMKIIIGLCFVLWSETLLAQDIPIPPNHSILDTVSGDLDGDGVKELVVAYNTKIGEEDNFKSIPRRLIIYKKGSEWVIWQQSDLALLGSRDGGMMGDPYEGMEIKSGILLIFESGGSSWKWNQIDKYRFQKGKFQLIGYTSNYGRPCLYWENVDFNLSTGKIIVSKEFESCGKGEQITYKKQNEIFYKKGLVITLQHRRQKDIKMVTPKYHREIYIATALANEE